MSICQVISNFRFFFIILIYIELQLQVGKELRQRGISAEHYHADMDAKTRERVHIRYAIYQ